MSESDSDFQAYCGHFPTGVSQAMIDFAVNTALLRSRYIFTRRVGSIQFGYCTHCRREYMTDRTLKHNEDWQCKKCMSLCTVKASGISRKYLMDDAYFVWFEKSAINPKAIVAMGVYAKRDYSGDYYKVETQHRPAASYLFEPGEGGNLGTSKMYRCISYWSGFFGRGATLLWNDGWLSPKSILSEFEHSMRNKYCYLAVESVVPAVRGTVFQYSKWEEYLKQSRDLVKFFDVAAQYSNGKGTIVEYLTKMGLRSFVDAKIHGAGTYGAINWKGKTIEKVLRMTKSEISELLSVKFKVNPITLHAYRTFKNKGIRLTFEQTNVMEQIADNYCLEILKPLLQYGSFETIMKYLMKQLSRKKKRYYSAQSALTTWRDYLNECLDIGKDLTKECVVFPNNLDAAHEKTSKQIKMKEDKQLNATIATRTKQLQKYAFEFAGLLIRPAKDSIELFNEGKALGTCVGGYANRYAAGTTDLFVIRKKTAPNKPYYTMEIIGNKITQVYGRGHCLPNDDVQAFLEAFKAEKLSKNSGKRNAKEQISQPA